MPSNEESRTPRRNALVRARADQEGRQEARRRAAAPSRRGSELRPGRRAQLHQAPRRANSDLGGEEGRLCLAQGHEMKVEVQASASPRELLSLDSAKTENKLLE